MSSSLKSVNFGTTSVNSKPLNRNDMVENESGGYVFAIDTKSKLSRALILGSEDGYYVNGKQKSKDLAESFISAIKNDENLVFEVIRDVVENNRAKKMDYTIFAFALYVQFGKNSDNKKTLANMILRTTTHLALYVDYMKQISNGKSSRSKIRPIANFYDSRSDSDVAYQMVKYRQRSGFTHQDLIRIGHPKKLSEENFRFAKGEINKDSKIEEITSPMIRGYVLATQISKESTKRENVKKILDILENYPKLPWEAFPTFVHGYAEFWKALFESGSLRNMALLRNIGRMAKLGLFDDMDFAAQVGDQILSDVPRAKIHPISYLLAIKALEGNDANIGSIIASALDDATEESFKFVEDTGKKFLVINDTSGSMQEIWGYYNDSSRNTQLKPVEVASALSLVLLRTQKKTTVMSVNNEAKVMNNFSKKDSFSDASRKLMRISGGWTNLGAGIKLAISKEIKADCIVYITDNEVNGGNHPYQLLQDYREKLNLPDTKMVVLATELSNFSISDPEDRNSLDVAGFDPNVPVIVTEFAQGLI